MESNPARGRGALLTTAGILVAVALVAIAARGSTTSGDGGPRRPADTLVDILLSFYVVALAAGAILFLYMLAIGRATTGQDAPGRRDWRVWLGIVVLVGALMLVVRDLPERRLEGFAINQGTTPVETTGTTPPGQRDYEPEFAWIPVLVTLGLVGVGIAGMWWAGRARRRERGELRPALAEQLAVAVDLSLDDLRAERDPRRAVIASYARLEAVLASHRLPRRPAEAPLEYLARILAEQSVSPSAARSLTRLFERAKFSHHAVGAEMKEEAIVALETVRDDLLRAQALRDAEREPAGA